jgi:hypothetical protein
MLLRGRFRSRDAEKPWTSPDARSSPSVQLACSTLSSACYGPHSVWRTCQLTLTPEADVPAPPDRSHDISLDEAKQLTRRHRQSTSVGMLAAAGGPTVFAEGSLGGCFKADAVRKLLEQPGCKFLRIYNGRDAEGKSTLVLVGVNGDFLDMTAGMMLEHHFPCPPFCPDAATSVLREDI